MLKIPYSNKFCRNGRNEAILTKSLKEEVNMTQRKYNKSKKKTTKRSKRIILPLALENYQRILDNKKAFREQIDEMIAKHPELFPEDIN